MAYDYNVVVGEEFSIVVEGSVSEVDAPTCVRYDTNDGGNLQFTAIAVGTGTIIVELNGGGSLTYTVSVTYGSTDDDYYTYTLLTDGTYSIKAKDVSNMPSSAVIPSHYEDVAITMIADDAFSDCTVITSVTIPTTVTSIGTFAFFNCTSLKSISIPTTVTSIGAGAFINCSKLETITIPSGVTSIGGSVFDGCTSLTEFVVDSSNGSFCAIDGNLYNKSATKLISYACGKSETAFAVPDRVESIETSAFAGCRLNSISIPNSVLNIGSGVFFDCTSLTSVIIGSAVVSIGDNAFGGCKSLSAVYYVGMKEDWDRISIGEDNELLTDDIIYFYSSTEPTVSGNWWHYVDGVPTAWPESDDGGDDEYFSYILMDSGTYKISAKNVNNMPADVVIPSTYNDIPVTYINVSAFKGCTVMKSVTIPDSINIIGMSAFEGCTGLTDVAIPYGVKRIPNQAFYNCASLESIVIPKSVTYISFSFGKCSSLKSVYYHGSSEEWNTIEIYESTGDKIAAATKYFYTETQPETTGNWWHYVDGVPTAWDTVSSVFIYTLLDDGTYSIKAKDIDSIPTSVVIPEKYNGIAVTTIEWQGFSNCAKMEQLSLPESITSILDYAFSGCTGLTSVTIPDSVIYMGGTAFSECSELKSVKLSNNLDVIRSFAFENCVKLETVTIPESVTEIQYGAFAGCSGLSNIDIPNSVVTIEESAFADCGGLEKIVIPDSVKSIGRSAFQYCYKVANISLGKGLSKIEMATFLGCTGFPRLVIPDNITSIGRSAFRTCVGLQSIVIGKGVMNIGIEAISDCTLLHSVFYAGSKDDWGGVVIADRNDSLNAATIYFYSEEKPTEAGNWWHYVDNTPVVWGAVEDVPQEPVQDEYFLISKITLFEIASAIRQKTGGTNKMTASDMAGEIATIAVGGVVPVFNLAELGLPDIPTDGSPVYLQTDTTEMIEALDAGAVCFTINTETMAITAVMASSKERIGDETDANICVTTQIVGDDKAIIRLVISDGVIVSTCDVVRELPEVTAEDNGKVLTVAGGAWSAADPVSPLPEVTAADNDKVLGVENGEWALVSRLDVDPDVLLPYVSASDNGKVLSVENGKWAAKTPQESGGGGVSSWNDLTDKPFGENEDGSVKQIDDKYLAPFAQTGRFASAFAEVESTSVMNSTFGCYCLLMPSTQEQYDAWMANTNAVRVTFDDKVYECMPQTLQGMVAVGNLANFGGAGNGEPFIVAIAPEGENYFLLILTLKDTAATQHKASVSMTDPSLYTLKEEYLPMDAIKEYIDDYINEALGGDY